MASAARGLRLMPGLLPLLCALLLPPLPSLQSPARGPHIKKAEAAAAAPGEALRYLHSAELGEALRALAAAAPPGLVRLFSIGQSVENRPLWVLRLTAGLGPERPDEPAGGAALPGRPQVKLVGNMHGDEPLARPLLLRLAWELVRGWAGGDERIVRLLNTTDLYLLPSLNPDGFERAQEGNCGGGAEGGRENSHGRDLNRSFPDQFGDAEPNLEPVPEVQALIDWMRRNRFLLSGNLHGGSVVASYPYDDSPTHRPTGVYSKSADDEVFRYLAKAYASHHPIMRTGKPNCPGEEGETFPDGITNGAQWYDVEGGMQDYNYVWANCFEITLELSCCKYPPTSELPKEWENNRESLLAFIEKVHIGVKGFVRDAITGAGLDNATIAVAGIAHNITAGKFGDFHRLLVPGTYNVTAFVMG